MDFGDSRNALFVEPNAYIQKFEKKNKEEIKKIVFQEPYEQLPNFYINNNFEKRGCDCVKDKKDTCSRECRSSDLIKKNSGFDLKKFLPLLGSFGKSGSFDFSSIIRNFQNLEGGGDLITGVSNLIASSGGVGNILNLFKKDNKQIIKKEIKTTDLEIKNYTRVD